VLGDSGETWFDISLMHKDIRLALAAARENRVPVLSAEAADQALTRATDLGFVHRDIAALFDVLAAEADVASP
ncbi:MAG: NAD-binding protein, partial [Kitasatospora sp.]|jgi:3-hydroxyisobutyrate dehydrogenase-like beta-hydroxyacid dehydrogenase|nr:NAD-binding protein [Kitasatospora sp.]